jgi:ribosomal protein L37AE/L43A
MGTDSGKRFYTPKDLIKMGYGSRSTVYRDLDKIAGGGRWNFVVDCPKCGSHRTGRASKDQFGCKDCGYRWEAMYSDTAPIDV